MKPNALLATALTVATNLPAYTGPLSRFLKRQAQVTADASAKAEQRTLSAMRHNVLALVEDPCLFTDAERLRTNDSVYQCSCVAQLQRWFRNVHRVYEQRSQVFRSSLADGSTVSMALAA